MTPPPPCVCGCSTAEHHAWSGPCNGTCGCSFYQPDDGSEGGPTYTTFTPYNGIYARRQWTA